MGPGGPLHNIHGHRGHKMSTNAGLITVETYVQQAKTIENRFFMYTGIWAKMWGKKNILAIWGALGATSHQY